MLPLLLFALCPFLSQARLGSDDIVELIPSGFDDFLAKNARVMVDFVDGAEDQTSELKNAVGMIRDWGSKVTVARVDATQYSDFAKRYFHNVGCSDRTQECGDRFPQLLWFQNGHPTQYHRMLRQPMNIASFVIALDREPMDTIHADEALTQWNQVAVVKCGRNSLLYRAAEVVASRNMDGVFFVHKESPGLSEVAWAINGTVESIFDGEPSADTIDAWLRTLLTLSEEVPDEPAQDGSVIVVGKTFEQIVFREDADVMMLVYAPWCGFSRKTLPQWANLAKLLKDVPGAPVIAKMDGSLNRSPLPNFHWTSFPTIVYVRKGEKKPILFDSTERTVEALIAFARNHGTTTFQVASDAIMLMQDETEFDL